MNVPETRPLFGKCQPPQSHAINEAARRAGLGRDNSVSLYRHNLLTAAFCGSSAPVSES